MESKVKLEINDKVAKIVLNDPENYNPLNQEMAKGLLEVEIKKSLGALFDGQSKTVMLCGRIE